MNDDAIIDQSQYAVSDARRGVLLQLPAVPSRIAMKTNASRALPISISNRQLSWILSTIATLFHEIKDSVITMQKYSDVNRDGVQLMAKQFMPVGGVSRVWVEARWILWGRLRTTWAALNHDVTASRQQLERRPELLRRTRQPHCPAPQIQRDLTYLPIYVNTAIDKLR